MMILRFFRKLLAIIGIICFSVLSLGLRVVENVGGRLAGVAIIILVILALMAICIQNWFAVAVFGVLIMCILAVLFGTATLEVLMDIGSLNCKTRCNPSRSGLRP